MAAAEAVAEHGAGRCSEVSIHRRLAEAVEAWCTLGHWVLDSEVFCQDLHSRALLAHDVCGLHNTLGQQPVAPSQDGCLFQGHAQGAPLHASATHGDLTRPQTVAELRGDGDEAGT